MSRSPHPGRRGRRSQKGRRKRPAAQVPSETLEVIIDDLGAQGDGVAKGEVLGQDQTIYVAGALPGERVKVQTTAKRGDGLVADILDILQPSADRIAVGCPYYEHCGGCALQHMRPQAYADWKRDRIVRVLAQRGFDSVEVLNPVLIPEGTRRRVSFTACRRGKVVTTGFNARSSHDIVAIDCCPLLVDGLNDLIVPLSEALQPILDDGARVRIAVTQCDNGADILIEGRATPGLEGREALAAFVQSTDAVRLSWKENDLSPDPITQKHAPLIYLSGVPVELPQGAFLQASLEGEQAIRDAVLEGLGENTSRIADLYCGLGSFSIPLSRHGIVDAYDAIEAPVRALERAAGRADLGGRIKAHVRDLSRQPLDAKELSGFDAVVFDPPRAGAAEQVQQLAEADVRRVVGVSCNPATFARDARILADGGFELISVRPIDQFTYSPHVELVAHFAR